MAPVLSICIPTYNRSLILKQALDSIVSQPVFVELNDIEIAISDNCSTDDTFQMIQPYLEKYKDKIIYNRNSENIHDKNFGKALSLGRGQFLKLLNDTIIMKDGSLSDILSVVKENLNEKPVIFFANGKAKQKKRISSFLSFENFFESASFQVTWIGAFGIWKDDYERIEDFNRASNLNLIQVDVLLRVFEWKKNSIIDNTVHFTWLSPEKKGGYDLIQVFADNYFQLLQIPIERKDLSLKAFKREQKRLLIKFFIPWISNVNINPEKYYFNIKDWALRLNKYYSVSFLTYAKCMCKIREFLWHGRELLRSIKKIF